MICIHNIKVNVHERWQLLYKIAKLKQIKKLNISMFLTNVILSCSELSP